jgi:hypothetical protein
MVTYYLPAGQRQTLVPAAPRKPGVFPLPYMGGALPVERHPA